MGRCRLTCLEGKISNAFAAYGRFASRHAVLLVIVPVIVCAGLGVGIMRIRPLDDMEEIYTPMNSQAKQDKAKIIELFPDFTADAFQPLNIPTSGRYCDIVGKMKTGTDGILHTQSLDEISLLHSFVLSRNATVDGQMFSYADFCAKNSGKCYVSGKYLLSTDFRTRVQANNVSYPKVPTTPAPIEVDGFLGGLTVVNGKVTKALYFKLRYNLRQDEGTEDRVRVMENKLIRELKNFESSALEITYSSSRSLGNELAGSVNGDIMFFSLTFTLMITYISVVAITTNMVASHANLARLGVLSTGLGLIAGLGLMCAVGLDFVQIVGITPFLIIGVGIDDVFVLLSGLAGSYDSTQNATPSSDGRAEAEVAVARDDNGDARPRDVVAERIAETLRTSGVAITITTLTNVLSLAIGASSVFISVRNFSIFTGACFLLAYLNHLTFFTGLMVLHERRVENSRHELLCCKTVMSKEEARGKKKSCAFVWCCTGKAPTNRGEAENFMETWPRMLTTKILSYLPARIVILIAFSGLLATAIVGVTRFKSGLELSDLAVDDSSYKTYDKWLNDHFRRREPVSIVMEETVDYRTGQVQSQLDQTIAKLKQDKSIDDSFEVNWLNDFRNFPTYDNSSSSIFITRLRTQFLPAYSRYRNDIVFNSDNTSITASRFYLRTEDVTTSDEQADSMQRLRGIVSASNLPAFCFGPGFVFYEQYLAVVPNTLQTVGVAVGLVFVVTALFMPSLLMIIFVTVALAISLVEIFGFMHFWGLTLSSLTMIHIIMSVGFSVDVESHICHAYLIADGNDRGTKVKHALEKVSGPIVHGTLSSILGLIMLVFSKSFIFRSFFQVMFLVLVLGMGQSLFLVPAILYFIGPRGNSQEEHVPETSIISRCNLFSLECSSALFTLLVDPIIESYLYVYGNRNNFFKCSKGIERACRLHEELKNMEECNEESLGSCAVFKNDMLIFKLQRKNCQRLHMN